ncbi:MAG: glycosyltransferase, partial [Planctomycetes bacterium]|nr:glycosyltransferase [Planctomycetota bacterium]
MQEAIILIVLVGVLLNLVLRAGLARALRKPVVPLQSVTFPPVSVLKPLYGADPGLEDNLATFFCLDYPKYQLVFGVEKDSDPAAAVVQKLMNRYPLVDAHLVIDESRIGHNPKVNNLANIAQRAKHGVFVISDSNVRVKETYLRDLMTMLDEPGAGLVTSPIRVVGGTGLGAKLEQIQLHTFVTGGMAAANAINVPLVVGKSMALRKSTLERIGGWGFLSQFLAEDQVCAQAVGAIGEKVRVTNEPVDNVIGDMTLAAFLARHERWGMLRKRIAPAAFVAELLFNPICVALLGLLIAPSWTIVAAALGAWLMKVGIERSAERALGVGRPLGEHLWLVPLKETGVLMAWFAALLQTTTSWRGRQYHIGARSRTTLIETVSTVTTAPRPSLFRRAVRRVSSAGREQPYAGT